MSKKSIFGLFCSLGARKVFSWMSDELYLKIQYYLAFREKLNIQNPVTYNEKLNWLKLYDRKDEYTMMVDKYEVKKFISDVIGEQYIIPTLGVWKKFDEIDFEILPKQFVLKCTHDSGGLVICKDKNQLDLKAAKRKINKSLKRNYFWTGREWPYKNVEPRIIAEPYIEDIKTKELRDYKFFAFDGDVKALFIATERQDKLEGVKFDFFDINYNHLDIRHGHKNAEHIPKKPVNFDKMVHLAEMLSKDIPQIRVDFYEANEKIYFGELTFYHHSGMVPFEPREWDKYFGDWINIK